MRSRLVPVIRIDFYMGWVVSVVSLAVMTGLMVLLTRLKLLFMALFREKWARTFLRTIVVPNDLSVTQQLTLARLWFLILMQVLRTLLLSRNLVVWGVLLRTGSSVDSSRQVTSRFRLATGLLTAVTL